MGELYKKVQEALFTAETQLHLDCSDFLNYAIRNTQNVLEKIDFFTTFKEVIYDDIKMAITKGFPTYEDEFENEHAFDILFSIAIAKTNELVKNNHISKSQCEYKFSNVTHELMYYHVYFNAYVKYVFGLIFNGYNDGFLEKLKEFNIDDLIYAFKEQIALFSISKLRISYPNEKFVELEEENERILNEITLKILNRYSGRFN